MTKARSAAALADRAAGTTTTSRSDRLRARLSPLLVASVASLSCGRAPRQQKQEPLPEEPSVTTPAGLLAEGVVDAPAEALGLARASFARRLRALPSSYPLAVVTTLGLSPLVVGLVDERAAIPFALVEVGGATGFAAAVRVTSGAELVAALAHGTGAAFRAEDSSVRGLTLLRPNSARVPFQLGVFRDVLVVGSTEAHVSSVGPYLARRSSETHPGNSIAEVVAPKDALHGPIPVTLRRLWSSMASGLVSEDRDLRERHGGKAPDFGDPEVVVETLSELVDGTVAVSSTLESARLSLSREGSDLRVHGEFSPGAAGEARNVLERLPTGPATGLLALPASTQVVALLRQWRFSEGAARFSRVLGSRMTPKERSRLDAWSDDVTAALGEAYECGIVRSGARSSLFLETEHADGEKLLRSVSGLPSILALRAISAPLEVHLGKLHPMPRVPALGSADVRASEVSLGAAKAAGPEPRSAMDVRVLGVTRGPRGVVLLGSDPEKDVPALLETPSATLGGDPVVSGALARAGKEAWLAVVLGGFEAGSPRRAVAVVGKNRTTLWADVVLPVEALAGLVPDGDAE